MGINVKKLPFAVIAVAVIAAVIILYFGTRAPQSTTSPAAPGSTGTYDPGTTKLAVTLVTVRDTTNKLATVRAEYPQFPSLADDFNARIAGYVNAKIAEFKQNAQDNWQARQATLLPGETKQDFPPVPFYVIITWQADQLDQKYVSFIIRFAAFEGGANERQEVKTFNYDVTAGREMTLADLFPGDSSYLSEVSQTARTQLTDQLSQASEGHTPTDMINEGTAPTAENFQNFTFNDFVINFYFPKYQVAPGAFGEQHVLITRKPSP